MQSGAELPSECVAKIPPFSRASVSDKQTGISLLCLYAGNPLLVDAGRLQPVQWRQPRRSERPRDTNLSSAVAIDCAGVRIERYSRMKLAQWEPKLSRPDAFTLPGGNVGMATGLELRRDTQRDDRDIHVDGTLTFTNAITGAVSPSDLIGTSDTPDTIGGRTVGAAYIEFAVPIVSPERLAALEVERLGHLVSHRRPGLRRLHPVHR